MPAAMTLNSNPPLCDSTSDDEPNVRWNFETSDESSDEDEGSQAESNNEHDNIRTNLLGRTGKLLVMGLLMVYIAAMANLLRTSTTRSLSQRLAQSGMPPHPGPDHSEDIDFAACQDDWNEARCASKIRVLTDEEEARIVTNRQRAFYKAKAKTSKENLPAQIAKPLTEEQILNIGKNKAAAKGKAGAKKQKKTLDRKIEKNRPQHS